MVSPLLLLPGEIIAQVVAAIDDTSSAIAFLSTHGVASIINTSFLRLSYDAESSLSHMSPLRSIIQHTSLASISTSQTSVFVYFFEMSTVASDVDKTLEAMQGLTSYIVIHDHREQQRTLRNVSQVPQTLKLLEQARPIRATLINEAKSGHMWKTIPLSNSGRVSVGPFQRLLVVFDGICDIEGQLCPYGSIGRLSLELSTQSQLEAMSQFFPYASTLIISSFSDFQMGELDDLPTFVEGLPAEASEAMYIHDIECLNPMEGLTLQAHTIKNCTFSGALGIGPNTMLSNITVFPNNMKSGQPQLLKRATLENVYLDDAETLSLESFIWWPKFINCHFPKVKTLDITAIELDEGMDFFKDVTEEDFEGLFDTIETLSLLMKQSIRILELAPSNAFKNVKLLFLDINAELAEDCRHVWDLREVEFPSLEQLTVSVAGEQLSKVPAWKMPVISCYTLSDATFNETQYFNLIYHAASVIPKLQELKIVNFYPRDKERNDKAPPAAVDRTLPKIEFPGLKLIQYRGVADTELHGDLIAFPQLEALKIEFSASTQVDWSGSIEIDAPQLSTIDIDIELKSGGNGATEKYNVVVSGSLPSLKSVTAKGVEDVKLGDGCAHDVDIQLPSDSILALESFLDHVELNS